jgi:hypothetical protein
VDDFSNIFENYAGPYYDLSNWQTSQVTSMVGTFQWATTIGDVTNWDVRNHLFSLECPRFISDLCFSQ